MKHKLLEESNLEKEKEVAEEDKREARKKCALHKNVHHLFLNVLKCMLQKAKVLVGCEIGNYSGAEAVLHL